MTLNLVLDVGRMPSTVNYYLELKLFKPGVFEVEIEHRRAVRTKIGLPESFFLRDNKVLLPKSLVYDITPQAFSTLK